ncbi:MAG: divergent PAP2 family protein [Clostridia bacterium]|nr:divergent PAP2 family protein [Clostridia bacterium]
MEWLLDVFLNKYLLTATISWFVGQILKTIIHWRIYKKFDIRRMFGDGGMPSCHSATVTSLATITGINFGLASFEFGIAAILAIVVCHDAMGVRLETGKQAVILNEIIKAFDDLSAEKLPEVKLKEFVGHTPIQVLAGIVLGFFMALILHFLVF